MPESDQGAATNGVELPADQPASPDHPALNDVPPSKISFNEILPDPVGKDADGEFIELANEGDADAPLAGWTIESAAGKIFTIPEITIAVGSYYYFPYAESKLVLTNTGASLTLRDDRGRTVSVVSYTGTAKEGRSYAKNADGQWLWTTAVTPGSANEFPVGAAPTPVAAETAASASDAAAPATEAAEPETATAAPTAAATADNGFGAEIASAADAAAYISVSEFLPNPIGADGGEWIELRNDGDSAVALSGWIVDDAEGGSQPFTLTSADVVPPRGFLLLLKTRTGLALNNDADSVRLFGPDGQTIEAVSYKNAAEGRSFEKYSGGWRWTETPTPGDPNNEKIADNTAKSSENDCATALAESAPIEPPGPAPAAAAQTADIGDLADMEDGAVVAVSGVINIPTGRIGKTLAGLQNEAGTAGVIARFYGTTPPEMAFGQSWAMTGKVSRLGDEVRLAVNTRDVRLEGRHDLEPETLAIADIDRNDAGIYVSVSGLVTGLGKKWLRLSGEDGSGEIRVSLSNRDRPTGAAKGDTVTAIGTLRFVQGEPELVAVAKDGVKKADLPVTETDAPEPAPLPLPAALVLTPAKITYPNYAAYGSVAALVMAAVLAAIWWKKRRYAAVAE